MNALIKIAAVVALHVAGIAVAAPTTELKVTGVIKATACVPSIGGNGVANLGVIPSASLKTGEYKVLRTELPFSVTCDAPAKLAIKATDNRATSAVPETLGASPNFAYGLGSVAGKKVGSYGFGIRASSVIVNGAAGNTFYSTDGGQGWLATPGSGQLGADRILSWSPAGSTVPAPVKTVTATLWVVVGLNKPENLPMMQEIPLDGSATLELLYL